MSQIGIWDALRPVARRMAGTVREHEILRVTATLNGRNPADLAEAARQETLVWAANRSAGHLPDAAWRFRDFECLAGGRTSVGVRIEDGQADIWAIRVDDPDNNVAGRVWTTEVAIGLNGPHPAQFSLRQLVSTPESAPDIEPHVPGLVQQIADKIGLWRGPVELASMPWLVESEDEADQLADLIVDPGRVLPVFVLSTAETGPADDVPLLNARSLARAVVGLAQVVVVPPMLTWRLTNRFGRLRSVYGGAVRAYLPGFAEDANPYNHRLTLAERLQSADAVALTTRWFRELAAQESLRRTRLGDDVLAFAAIRSARFQQQRTRFEAEGASDSERLRTATQQVEAIQKQLDEERKMLSYFSDEHRRANERAETAEAQLRGAEARIDQLVEQIKSWGERPDANIRLPAHWKNFADWCDTCLSGRVVLSPAARRSVKAPEFEDVALASRCLLWLANDCREGRMGGAGRSFANVRVEDGVLNARCGGDEYSHEWRGRRRTVDWHIKSGGNTHDPARCLRIYYFWDDDTQQIVVTDMPAHRRTGAT